MLKLVKDPVTNPGGIASSSLSSRTPKKGVKRKLDYKSFEKKYQAIMEAEKGIKSKKSIAAEFSIPASTLSTWLKNADEIKKMYVSGDVAPQRKKARGAKYPEVEDALLKWFQSARNQGVPISGEICQEKARDFARRLGISETEFDCSTGWLDRFKTRHSITFKRVCGEAKAVDTDSDAMNDWKQN